ncbi:MAG: hypothetical protein HGB12_07220, partial [Bacteroidetes bacterium]|nr:hypothetical protein [Bacteroidota bacterium]
MSAIFGIVNKKGNVVEESSVNAIRQAIAHRATDGSGLWQKQNIVFGHCNLFVYPQQKDEQLPLESENLVITADARIDNRSELSERLGVNKHLLANTSDSQLILLSYKKWEKLCVNYLEGEFAFAIWDKQNHDLFIATDHIGFRPVFYYDSPEIFIFCSEMKGVVAAKTTPDYFNEESLIEYHFKQGTPCQTYNKEVFTLCGGSTLTLQNNILSIAKYWELQAQGKYHFSKDEEWEECLRDLLYKAIEKRLNPDVPVGITLSGGLDSTSIACILSELLQKKNKPLYAFSSVLPIGHKGIEEDERKYIEIVGRHCPNIIQSYVEAPNISPFTDLEKAFEMEESFPNIFFYMDKALLEAAKEKNIRILFTGFGGDYWVSWKGYSVIYLLIKQGKLNEAWNLIQQFSKTEQRSVLRVLKSKYLSQTNWYKFLRSMLLKNKKNKEIDWQVYTTLQDNFVKKYKNRVCPDIRGAEYAHYMQDYTNSGRLGMIISRIYNRNNMFDMDSSVPLLDKTIFEFLSEVPLRLFVKGGCPRSLIRNAMEGIIPTKINERKDKLPYSPGYHNRIIREKELFNNLTDSPEYNFVFDKYIDRKRVVDHFDDIVPEKGFTPSGKITGIR